MPDIEHHKSFERNKRPFGDKEFQEGARLDYEFWGYRDPDHEGDLVFHREEGPALTISIRSTAIGSRIMSAEI